MNRPELILQIATLVLDRQIPYEDRLKVMVNLMKRVNDLDIQAVSHEFGISEGFEIRKRGRAVEGGGLENR